MNPWIARAITHDEYLPYGQNRPPAIAAASYGDDIVKMLNTSVFTPEQIALHAHCAFRFASMALESAETPCTHCEAATATQHTEPDSPHDPLCQTCDERLWTVCEGCGARVHHEDLGEYLVAPASQGGPAEYAPCCMACRPEADDEPDYDRIRDDQEAK